MKTGVIVGSLRKESYSRKVAEAVVGLFPENFEPEFINIDLPLYNQDLEDGGGVPQSWTDFRAAVKFCGAFLFVTPEYNRSLPAVIKNALDVGSRPQGQSAWGTPGRPASKLCLREVGGKKGAVISISPGKLGGFGANHAFRQAVVFLDIALLQQPEMYIGEVAGLFDENGAVKAQSREFLQKFSDKFTEWVG